MYEPLLLVHSWTRWVVLIGIFYFLIKSLDGHINHRKWSVADNHFIWAFDQVFGYQVVMGLALWLAASPFLKLVIQNPSIIFQDGTVSFWSIRHPVTMIIAIGVFQVGKARARRKPVEGKYKTFAITFLITLILIVSAIPWPWLAYGRPYLRLFP